MNEQIYKIAKEFKLTGNILDIIPYGTGLINNTFLIKTTKIDYIIQKINNFVFKNPEMLMENIYLVTKYIKRKGGNSLELIKTKDNLLLKKDASGFYRCYKMIKNSKSFDIVIDDKILLRVGKTISSFQYLLKDYDVNKIHITLPNFHDLKFRYYELIKAFRNTNSSRKDEVRKFIYEIINVYKNEIPLSNMIEKGLIKKRVCHYDTKLNNFLFLENKKDCLIDLDTVMPGISIFDFGDCARNVLTNIKEDEYNIDVELNYKRFVYLVIGYLSIGKNYLSTNEINNLVNSIKLISLELSVRFLTDYLKDDIYFKIDYEKHNFYRSLCQFNIFNKVNVNYKKLNNIVVNIYQRINN
jgi:hypothetical protein